MTLSRIARIVFVALIAIPIGNVSAKILDRDGPPHPILSSLADALDAAGVDVILGKAADFAAPERPRLATLEGFESSRGRDWGRYWQDVWTTGFEEGLMGALLATERGEEPPALEREMERCRKVPAAAADVTCDFVEEWLAAGEGKRVFIAFTRSDLAHAVTIRAALKESGYAGFIYLRDGEHDPWAHPDFVGAIFKRADHRLVIDTKNSRGSEGVEFEATCVQALAPKRTPKDTRWLDFVQPK